MRVIVVSASKVSKVARVVQAQDDFLGALIKQQATTASAQAVDTNGADL